MNFDWIAVASLILSLAAICASGAIYVMRNTSKDEAGDAVDKLESDTIDPLTKSVVDHDRRIIRLEEQLKAMPTARDFRNLENKVTDLAGDIKELTSENRALHGIIERVEKSVGIMNEALLSKAR